MRGSLIVALGAAAAALVAAAVFFPKLSGPRGEAPISAADVSVTDADTIRARGKAYRLVGFDTPETAKAKCEAERQLGDKATARLQALIDAGDLTLQEVRCSCAPGTEGTRYCNFGRLCGTLKAKGVDTGEILIREGLARPFRCGEFRCPKRKGWC